MVFTISFLSFAHSRSNSGRMEIIGYGRKEDKMEETSGYDSDGCKEGFDRRDGETKETLPVSWGGEKLYWWEALQKDPHYDDEEMGYRPLDMDWPKNTQLRRDQFTEECQRCIRCSKDLKYQFSMDPKKPPNSIFFFCGPECREKEKYVPCFFCGNLQSESTCYVVSAPCHAACRSESARVFRVMCHHCYKTQQEQALSPEELRHMYRQWKDLQKTKEQESQGGGGGSMYEPFRFEEAAKGMVFGKGGEKRKRDGEEAEGEGGSSSSRRMKKKEEYDGEDEVLMADAEE